MPMPAKNMAGRRFGRLLTLERAGTIRGQVTWRCRCDCGAEKVVSGSLLRRGITRSCGCLNRDTGIISGQINGKTNTLRHGHARKGAPSPEYIAWRGMWSRCRNLNSPRYPDWGGRGIKVCDRWQDFASFLADMGPKPRPTRQYTLGRIDNDGDYTPENCQWETWLQQRHNRRDTPR